MTRLRASTLTPWIGPAPEDYRAVLILLGTQNLMKLERKPVQVADVERAEVMVEVVVEEDVINGEVVRLPVAGLLNCLGTVASSV